MSEVEQAFEWRAMPASAIDRASIHQFDSDVEDADWFSGKDWRDATYEDWREHMCAYIFMSAEAAVYYLPSLLIISAQRPQGRAHSLDCLMGELDCTPELGVRDERIRSRYFGWRRVEYEALQNWLLFMSEHAPDLAFGTSGLGDSFGRAFELVELLKREQFD